MTNSIPSAGTEVQQSTTADVTTSAQLAQNPMLAEVLCPQKAYEIDLNRLEEGFLSDTIMCYANSVNEAKSILLAQIKYDDWKLKYTKEEINYLNIPVVRKKEADKRLFENSYFTEIEINRIIFQRDKLARLNEILNDEKIKYCYIKKGSYYRPNSCGYTDLISQAGVYTKEEAVAHAKFVSEIIIIPIDIKSHNEMIKNEISQLQGRVL